MTYTELDPRDLGGGLTTKPHLLFGPVLDELTIYRDSGEHISVDLCDLDVGVQEGQVTVSGYPFDPYVQRRVASYLMGIKQSRWDFWDEHPELYASALRQGAAALGGNAELVITQGRIVALNALGIPLYDHLDFIEPMVETFVQAQRATRSPFALVGFQVDPLWTHLKVLFLPESARHYALGLQMDANFLFSNLLRGRATFSLFVRDIVKGANLNLDAWWSVRTPQLRAGTGDIRSHFVKRLERDRTGISKRNRNTLVSLAKLDKKRPERPWRQGLIAELTRIGAGKKRINEGVAAFHEGSRLEYAFTLAQHLSGLPLDRRLAAERTIASYLRKGV